MHIARPREDQFQECYEFLNWISEQLEEREAVGGDFDDTAFIDRLSQLLPNKDHKFRHILCICENMIEQTCKPEVQPLAYLDEIAQIVEANRK